MDKHSHERMLTGGENRARGPQLTFNPFQSLKLDDILYQLNWSNKNNEFKTERKIKVCAVRVHYQYIIGASWPMGT